MNQLNETEWILLYAAAFCFGYFIAYFFKNLGKFWRKWHILAIGIIPAVLIYLIAGAAALADFQNITLSLTFAAGFALRMMKREHD